MMATNDAGAIDDRALVRPSKGALAWFAVYLHWFIGRHFRAFRVAHFGRFPEAARPLIVYCNHASWWDPLSCIILSRYLMPAASHYAPMEAGALRKYTMFRKLGLFPVEMGTRRGAAQFLRAATEIMSSPDSVLWITPEGQFTDPRTRPAIFRSGLSALVARLPGCTVVPLALEYTFWDERLPELLVSCGKPIVIPDGHEHSAEHWNEVFARALTDAQDELAGLAMQRNPGLFETLLSGRVGVSGVYEAWKRLQAAFNGRAYLGSHGSIR